ncbi:hypothetical protein MHYP_G00335640 [Metynnis hypsauchen]
MVRSATAAPLHQVLDTAPNPAGVQEAADSVSWGASYKTWSGGPGPTKERPQAGHVERRVDPHGGWKAQPVGDRVHPPIDLERPHIPRGQLLGLHMEWKILGRKPGRKVGAGRLLRSATCFLASVVVRREARAFCHALRQCSTNCSAAGTPTSRSSSGNMGGGNPNWHSKGDMPKDKCWRVLWAYSAQGRCSTHEEGLAEVKHRRVRARSWLTRSVWPLDSGWKPEERLTEAPMSWQKAFQKRLVNWGPRSDTRSLGIP